MRSLGMSHVGEGLSSLGKETCWPGEDSVLGLGPCGFVVPTPAASLTSTSVTLDLGRRLWTVGRLPVLRPRMAVGMNSANAEQELKQHTALRRHGSLDCSRPPLTSSGIVGS